ncbi:twin transmembrane helix small protein [Ottowia testudinis]|uniref:Twin transmembrane helix small protein n=1 Tax=Ottowia testudinis TaxID=2816950 RepID=A0A975CJL3_9BURK|nr:twin transmembrane helix small protein [Ottowia testudinis]QTD44623.1 twin transmembrane helix small protein [Ottowia testudinis]
MKQMLFGLAFAGILGSLASALVFMLRRDKPSQAPEADRAKSMMRALALRVGLSVLLFICVLLAWKLGYIQPSGISSGA